MNLDSLNSISTRPDFVSIIQLLKSYRLTSVIGNVTGFTRPLLSLCSFHTLLLARLDEIRIFLDILQDTRLLVLFLESPERFFERLTFLYKNLYH